MTEWLEKHRTNTVLARRESWNSQDWVVPVVMSSRIRWEKGPEWSDGHRKWKQCIHHIDSGVTGSILEADSDGPWGYSVVRLSLPDEYAGYDPYARGSLPKTGAAVAAACSNLFTKLDLNAKDRVLSYSYAIDLLPFVGALTRLNSVFRRILRSLEKRFRHTSVKMTFGDVLSLLIDADLINRFVIQTTVQDTLSILNIWNELARTWDRMNVRNSKLTTLTGTGASSDDGIISPRTRCARPRNFADGGIYCSARWQQSVQARAFLTAQLDYDSSRADPLKWYAAKMGITTPLESVWDKIPFSFIADYFFRIGEAVEEFSQRFTSQDALIGHVADVKSFWITTKAFRGVEFTADPGSFYWTRFETVNHKAGSSRYGQSEFSRFPGTLGMIQSSDPAHGQWKPELGPTRMRTLFELGYQMVWRHK